jgi:sugar phosphate isomerase/epimerase
MIQEDILLTALKQKGYILNESELKEESKLFHRALEEILVERINKISIKAKECGVELLLENNVMNKRSFDIINFNATLMSDPVEIDYFMTNTNNNVNLLMDIAHLKVSSNVLKFDLNDALDSA